MLVSKRQWVPPTLLNTQWGNEHRALETGQNAELAGFEKMKIAMFVRRWHNCWLHCDFPSECHHAMYKAQQEGRPVLSKATAVDEAYITLKKVERARGMLVGQMTEEEENEEEDEDEESDSGEDGEDSGISSTAPLPPLATLEDDGSDHIQVLLEVEDLEAIYLSPRAQRDEISVPVRTYPGGSKASKMDIDLDGDYSYEVPEWAPHSSICEANTSSDGKPRTHSEERKKPSSLLVPSPLNLGTELKTEGNSPPLSPFSLAQIAAAATIMSDHLALPIWQAKGNNTIDDDPAPVQQEYDAVVPVKAARNTHPSLNNDDNKDIVPGVQHLGDVRSYEDEDEEGLDGFLNALFPKTLYPSRRSNAMKAQYITLLAPQNPTTTTTINQQPVITSLASMEEVEGGSEGKHDQSQLLLQSFIPFERFNAVAAPEPTSTLPLNSTDYDDFEEGYHADFTTRLLVDQAHSDQAWFSPSLPLEQDVQDVEDIHSHHHRRQYPMNTSGRITHPESVAISGMNSDIAVPIPSSLSSSPSSTTAYIMGDEKEEDEKEERGRMLTFLSQRTSFSQPHPPQIPR